MRIITITSLISSAILLAAVTGSTAFADHDHPAAFIHGDGDSPDSGNRYLIDRHYNSDISAAKAYLLANSKVNENGKNAGKRELIDWDKHEGSIDWTGGADNDYVDAVIIDVRSIDEYTQAHAEGAYHIPYPHITYKHPIGGGKEMGGGGGQNAWITYVMTKFPDLDTPILTMCRSGKRSVWAANMLHAAGYTNVRNIWEGVLGGIKTVTVKSKTTGQFVTADLDVNNNGTIDGLKMLAPGAENADADGWGNYQQLPVTDTIVPDLIYTGTDKIGNNHIKDSATLYTELYDKSVYTYTPYEKFPDPEE